MLKFSYFCLSFLLFGWLSCVFAHTVRSPGATPTVGAPWPMPASYSASGVVQPIDAYNFRFQTVGGQSCDILESAYVRYHRILFGEPRSNERANQRERLSSRKRRGSVLKFFSRDGDSTAFGLSGLQVNLANECDFETWPSLDMDESYTLSVSTGSAVLKANEIWGVLRGLETFSQLIYYSSETDSLSINNTEIRDEPRFRWRGILLDTSRHYLSKENILWNLEAMAYNKINVFHWHIVDDQSFPYQSKRFPALSDQGAYDPYTHVYTLYDIMEILFYARERGIRVVPEFDSPGHSQSWGKGQQGLLTPCYDGGKFNGGYGPIDPTVDSTYTFLTAFVSELVEIFRDKYLHLGGDEVSFDCWKSNPNVTDFMNKQGFGTDYSKLESYYMQKLLKIVASTGNEYVVWQEVFDNGVKVLPDTVIEVWKGGEKNELARVTASGLKAILASPWYLDYISYGSDWKGYYSYEPLNFNGTEAQKALVMGGEACLWAEMVDDTNVESRLWPRASAVAERLWSPAAVNDVNAAAQRLEEHRCRMVRRGIMAEPPSGPGFCSSEARRRS